MHFYKKTVSLVKLLVTLSIFVSVFLTPAQKVNAQYVDISNAIKEYPADFFGYELANRMIRKVANSTVSWINSGFKGNPAYVTDPSKFFLEVGDNLASDFLSGPKMNSICTPFQAKVRLALVKNYVSQDNENYSCSLSKLKNNYDQFINDFKQGGWDGWFEITQVQSNNPYGAYLQAQTNLSKQLSIEKNKYVKQLEQGKGFLSFERCKPSSVLSQSDINSLGDAGKKYKVGDCWNNDKEVVTPGSVIENQLNNVLSSGQNRLEAADEIDEVVGALLNQLLNRVVGGFGKGLRGASESKPGTPSVQDQYNTEPKRSSSNPNAGQVSGGQPNCSLTPSSNNCTTTCVDDGLGGQTCSTDCSSTQGSTSCSVTPVEFNEPTGITDGGDECTPPPTPEQRAEAQAVTDAYISQLPIPTLPLSNPYPTNPPDQAYVNQVQAIVNSMNSQYPNQQGQYYPLENDIGLPFTYIVGPATIVVSNQIGPGTTWRMAWRVTCDVPTGGGGAPAPADSLSKHPDSSSYVSQAKSNLQTRGVNLSGACGAWEIVNEAAKLIGNGAGLLRKASGNNCNGYSVDIIAFPDGYIYDVIIDSGNQNTPTWNPTGCGTNGTCPDDYRPAV